MHRGAVLHVLPWMLLVIGLAIALRGLTSLAGGRWRSARFRSLHSDQAGAVQTLSFVLTVPFFVMALMLMVQAGQLMLAQMVVEYAAVAAARAAIVWIPAATSTIYEGPNCISSYSVDGNQSGAGGGTQYLIQPGSPKYQRIQNAAVLACAPISPSRSIPGVNNTVVAGLNTVVNRAYSKLAPTAYAQNPVIAQRLLNKLAYSAAATNIQITFVHPSQSIEPPLATWNLADDIYEYRSNEVGFQDSITVTVTHRLALLPGPGRLLFTATPSYSGSAGYSAGGASSAGLGANGNTDQVAASIQQNGALYTYTLTAATTLMVEGEKSTMNYVYTP
jgi:hypothetical protein